MRQLRTDLRIRVGAGEDNRIGSHAQQPFRGKQVGTGQTHEHIGAVQRVVQRPLVGFVGEHRLVLVEIVTTGMDHALAVDHEDVLDLRAEADQQLHAGSGGGAGTEADDLRVLDGLAGDFQGVEHAGRSDDGGTVLVVMEYGDIALLDQRTLDLEALRCLDVLEVDAAEGDGDALDGIDESLRAFRIDFDIEYIDAGETLEQHALAFHNRFRCQRAQIAQTENGGAIGNHRHQVALACVLIGERRVTPDFAYRCGNARAVCQRKIARSCGGLGQLDTQLSGTGIGVIVESGSFKVSHGISAFIFTWDRQAIEHTPTRRALTTCSEAGLVAGC